MALSRTPRFMLAVVAGFMMIAPASATRQSSNDKRLVEGVMIMGNRRLTAKELLSHLKTRVGRPYRPGQAQRDLQTLLDMGSFDPKGTHVSTDTGLRGGVVVMFEVTELPTIEGVTFEGLGTVPEADVLKALRRARIDLSPGTLYHFEQLEKARLVIQKYLRSQGRPYAKVELGHENLSSMNTRLKFVITNEASF